MPDTWVTDLRHFLDESGELATELPGPALNLVLHLGAIASWVTGRALDRHETTNVMCRRAPGRMRCRGEIMAGFDTHEAITWMCPICGDNGVIRGWEGTQWDRTED